MLLLLSFTWMHLELGEELRTMCRRILKNGYNVLLPNLFYRVGTEGNYPFNQLLYKKSKEELNKMISTMNNTTNNMIIDDTKYIIDYINNNFDNSNGIGIVGYCMSGRFVVSCGALYADKILAIASFYGVDILTEKDDSPHLVADKIKGELYLAFAEKDKWVPKATLSKIKKKVFLNIKTVLLKYTLQQIMVLHFQKEILM